MNKSNYSFVDQKNAAMQSYLNAWEGDNLGFAGQQSLNADGAGDIEESKPYIFTITNTTTDSSTVSNVTLLNAAVNQFSPGQTGVTKTYTLAGLTYQAVLGQFASGKPFEVGRVMLIATHPTSDSIANQQVRTAVEVRTNNPSGSFAGTTLNFFPDAYAQSKNQTICKVPFLVDALTGLTFASIYGAITLEVWIYPKKIVSQFEQLNTGREMNAPTTSPALGAGR